MVTIWSCFIWIMPGFPKVWAHMRWAASWTLPPLWVFDFKLETFQASSRSCQGSYAPFWPPWTSKWPTGAPKSYFLFSEVTSGLTRSSFWILLWAILRMRRSIEWVSGPAWPRPLEVTSKSFWPAASQPTVEDGVCHGAGKIRNIWVRPLVHLIQYCPRIIQDFQPGSFPVLPIRLHSDFLAPPFFAKLKIVLCCHFCFIRFLYPSTVLSCCWNAYIYFARDKFR